MVKTVLYVVPSKEYFKYVIKILKKLAKDQTIIYVTTNKPYESLRNLINQEKIKYHLMIIDCISKQITTQIKDAPDCIYLNSPQNVTGMGITLNKLTSGIPGKKTVIFDSLSAMLIYNHENVIGKFSNFIMSYLRTKDTSTVMFVLETDIDKNVIKLIESMVDEVK